MGLLWTCCQQVGFFRGQFNRTTFNSHLKTMVDRSLYKVGVVISAENLGEKGQKPMKVCRVDVGDASDTPLTIVTSATNVREGSRYV